MMMRVFLSLLAVLFASAALDCDVFEGCGSLELERMKSLERERLFGFEFDPPELPTHWWLQKDTGSWWRREQEVVPPEKCDSARICVRMRGTYGHTNNALDEWISNMKRATFEDEKALVLSEAFGLFMGTQRNAAFDVKKATRSWSCVLYDSEDAKNICESQIDCSAKTAFNAGKNYGCPRLHFSAARAEASTRREIRRRLSPRSFGLRQRHLRGSPSAPTRGPVLGPHRTLRLYKLHRRRASPPTKKFLRLSRRHMHHVRRLSRRHPKS